MVFSIGVMSNYTKPWVTSLTNPNLGRFLSLFQLQIDKYYLEWIDVNALVQKFPTRVSLNDNLLKFKGIVYISWPPSSTSSWAQTGLVGIVTAFGLLVLYEFVDQQRQPPPSYYRSQIEAKPASAAQRIRVSCMLILGMFLVVKVGDYALTKVFIKSFGAEPGITFLKFPTFEVVGRFPPTQ